MVKHKIIGIDLAKNSFYLFILNKDDKAESKKKLTRTKLLAYLAQQTKCTVAMEACATSHYWAREIQKLGHSVQLLPAQHVKGYLRGQKNDYNDALAIAEACLHGAIRPVPIKNIKQQDEQTFLQMRRHLSAERTRLINHVRGLLSEYGLILNKGSTVLQSALPGILEDANNNLTDKMRALVNRQYYQLVALEDELSWYDKQLKLDAKNDEVCQRLIKIPGFGPVVSKVVKSWMGDGKQFQRGRDASAALGLVPKQFSTGGRDRLLGISKRGDSYVRSQVVHGARAVVCRASEKNDPLSLWINRLVEARGFNKAVVALANKLTRVAWVIIARNEQYIAVK